MKSHSRKQTDKTASIGTVDTSDEALADLLRRVKVSVDENEIRELSAQIERIIFHKQFSNA